MKRSLFIGLLFIISGGLLYGQAFAKTLKVVPFQTDGSRTADILASASYEAIHGSLFFVPGILLSEDPDADLELRGVLQSEGRGFQLSVTLTDPDGRILMSESSSFSRALGVFNAADQLAEQTVRYLSGGEVSPLGSLVLYVSGDPDIEWEVSCSGRVVGQNIRRISRIPEGEWDLVIRQLTGPDPVVLFDGRVPIAGNEETVVEISPRIWSRLELIPSGSGKTLAVYNRGIRYESVGGFVRLPAGVQEIRIVQVEGDSEYTLSDESLTLDAWETVTLSVSTVKLVAGIELINTGDPGPYRVVVDGREYPDSPFGIPLLPAGEHDVTIYQIGGSNDTLPVLQTRIKTRGRRPVQVRFALNASGKIPDNPLVRVSGGNYSRKGIVRRVSSFYMGKYEVTRNLVNRVAGKPPVQGSGGFHPAVDLTWMEAVEFCNKLSQLEGLDPCYSLDGTAVLCDVRKNGYRLPTRDEWEYAVVQGSLGQVNFDRPTGVPPGHYGQSGQGDLRPVGTYPPNALGLHDLSGNASEYLFELRTLDDGTVQALLIGGLFVTGPMSFWGEFWGPVDLIPRTGMAGDIPFAGIRLVRTIVEDLPAIRLEGVE